MIPFHLRRPHINDYINGFILAVILTAIPFVVVGYAKIGSGPALILISTLALIQIAVHLRFFLHYTTKRVPVEAKIALAMSIFIIAVIIFGSIWIMSDLDHRMMP